MTTGPWTCWPAAIYQYVDNKTPASALKREQVWSALNSALQRMPSRNNLICAGDFNCALEAQHPWVGATQFTWQGRKCSGLGHHDHVRLRDILKAHGLTAIDTWGPSGATFVHSTVASRIDHFLIRLYACDGQSKQVQFLYTADFVPDNTTHHVPILCSFRSKHMAYQTCTSPPTCTYAQRSQCRLAGLQETQAWHSLRQQVVQALQADTQHLTPEASIQHIHDHVSTAFHKFFSPKKNSSSQANLDQVHDTINDKWHHKRQLRRTAEQGSPTLKILLQAWHHRSRYQALQRAQQKATRQARRDRFNTLCHEVAQAATLHDTHSMFGIINRFSPKKPLARTRLRGPDGTIADQYMAHAMTVAFVQSMWQGPAKLPTYHATAPGIPFDLEELVAAVAKLHTNKSVAQPFLPGVVWRSAPLDVARFIYQHLQYWWLQSPPIIPQNWKDSWLFFLPKPGKANTHPDQLRPISLMEPLGKIVMGLLTTKIKDCIFPELSRMPQFGFLPCRAATDAILRVAGHSRQVREMVATHRRTVKNQIAGIHKLTCCGGVSLFLDLNRAFDCADRQAIFDHLIRLGTPSNLVQLAASWHEQTQYNLLFRGQTTAVPVGKGLRQGCKLAPLLWVSFMDLFLRTLAIKTGIQWIHDCITVYADDVHVGCQFRSKGELQTHLTNIGHALDVIESMKLSLSYSKSHMLIAYAGTNTRHALKGVMQRLPNGVSIKVPRAGGRHTCLPLRNKGSYLGAVISYHNFELLTWQHRKQAGWSAFARLRAWLRSRQLSRANRFYLWKTCVYTVLTYGLMSTGVNIRVLMEFQGTIFQMVRTILNDHSYITHRSHQSAFQFHHIDQPLEMLQALAMGLLTRIQRRDIHMLPHDFLHQLDWQPLHDVLQLIRSLITAAPEVPISVNPEDPVRTQAGQQCPHCHFMTDSIPNMRRHLTTQHGEPRYRTESISPLAMTANGKPQCNNCLFVFSTWKSFLVHVQRACCQVRRSMTEPPQPDVQMSPTPAVDQVHRHYQVAAQQFWPELERCIQTDDWTGLKRLEPCLEHLTHHFAICGTWCNRFQELHSHYRLYHDAQLKGGVAKGAQLTQVLQLSSPCELCHKAYSRVHSCPVALQVAILRLQMQEPDIRQQTELTCEICVQQFDDHSQMYQHMAREHGQTLSDWIPSRDSVQGSNQCRHCTLQFDSRSGLRRHITEGRCEAFDPLASLNPQDTTSQWSTWLRSGDFSPTGLTAHQRLQLTTTCQFCAVKYMRTGDLVAHLLQSHGPLWNDSQHMLRYLLQVVMASRGCICNPQAHEVGLAHICTPLRQVAMMMVSNDVPILVPTRFQATSLATQLSYLHDDAWPNE